jgi:hypothetical protein
VPSVVRGSGTENRPITRYYGGTLRDERVYGDFFVDQRLNSHD